MTEPEKIEDIIAQMRRGFFGSNCADRLRAALERERAAVLKVAEDIEKYIAYAGEPPRDSISWDYWNWLAQLAAELRRIAGGEEAECPSVGGRSLRPVTDDLLKIAHDQALRAEMEEP